MSTRQTLRAPVAVTGDSTSHDYQPQQQYPSSHTHAAPPPPPPPSQPEQQQQQTPQHPVMTAYDPDADEQEAIRRRLKVLMVEFGNKIAMHQLITKPLTAAEFDTLHYAFDNEGMTDYALALLNEHILARTHGKASLKRWPRKYFPPQYSHTVEQSDYFMFCYGRSVRTKIILRLAERPMLKFE